MDILDKIWLDNQSDLLCLWQQEAYDAFASMIADKENTYPCVLGRQGFLQNQFKFSFIDDPRNDNAVQELTEALHAYGKHQTESAGKYTSLVALFNIPNEIHLHYSVEDYRQLFWKLLNGISASDKTNWPDTIPGDPAHHKWEFCFNGKPYFVFCATPAHVRRKSRHFPFLMLAFQPRWVFDNINDTTRFGRSIKQVTRKRLVNYDGLAPHPALKWYGEPDNFEWKQYFLSDDGSSPAECPFKRLN